MHHAHLTRDNIKSIRAMTDWKAVFKALNIQKSDKDRTDKLWRAYSPFGSKRPLSFYINSNGIWYDYSVGMGGGPIELVQRLKHCSLTQAAKIILKQGWIKSTLPVKDIQNRISSVI